MGIEEKIFGALREEDAGETYSATVPVTTWMGSESKKSGVDHTVNATVNFSIFVEKARYGIAGITAGNIQDFSYGVQLEDEDGNATDVDVAVKGDALTVEYTPGLSVTLEGIDITINDAGEFVKGEATFYSGAAR